MEKNVVILGGGVTGLSLAWKLAEAGISVDVLESQSIVGGLAATIRQDSYCLDIGPHSFFSDEQNIVKEVLELFDYTLQPTARAVKFFFKNKYLDYPLTPQGVLLQMGLLSGLRVAFSYFKEKLLPHRSDTLGTTEETVEDWAISSFGYYMYHIFFKPYTEQFWKLPCSELSSRSIPTHTRLSFLNTLLLLLRRRVTKTGQSLIEREALPTYFPKTGFGEIPEMIARKVEQLGGNIHLNSEATALTEPADGKMSIQYNDKESQKQIDADFVISTIPLPCLVRMLSPKPPAHILASAAKLQYRSLVALGMATEKQNILGCSYMYMLDKPYNRISEMNEFSPYTSPPGKNLAIVEIPCLRDSAAWTASKEDLFDMCIGSLAEDRFLTPGDVTQLFSVKIPAAYPIYRKDYVVHLTHLINYVKKYDSLATLGRCGEFMYMDIDKCISRAFTYTDKLLKKLQT